MIRSYRQQDLEAILEVWEQSSKIAHSFLNEIFFIQERQAIKEQYLPTAQTFVYEQKGEVCGFISLIDNLVGGFFVKPSLQGQGIGQALMNYAVQLQGQLEVEVFELNSIGRNFYQKYGFTVIEKSIHPETGFILIRMSLKSVAVL